MTNPIGSTLRIFVTLPLRVRSGEYSWANDVRPLIAILSYTIVAVLSSLAGLAVVTGIINYYDFPVTFADTLKYFASSEIVGIIRVFAEALGLWLVCRKYATFGKATTIVAALAVCKACLWTGLIVPAALIAFMMPEYFLVIAILCLPFVALLVIYLLTLTIIVFKRAIGISTARAWCSLGCLLLTVPLLTYLPDKVAQPDMEAMFLYFRNNVCQTRYIANSSLEPALLRGDRLFVSLQKSQYPPSLREIWLFYKPGSPKLTSEQIIESSHARYDDHAMIKRVAGVAGDHIEVVAGVGLRRNGDILYNWPLAELPTDSYEITVPDEQIFMLGDNVNQSEDSRRYGCVPVSNMIGRAIYIFYPFNRAGAIK